MTEKLSFNKMIILGILVIFFYAIILLAFDIEKIGNVLNQINPFYYMLIFPITGLTLTVQAWRYQLTLSKLGIAINFKDSFLIYAAGLSMLLTPGGSGAIIKSYLLKIKTGKSFSSTTPVLIYEKWLELVAIVTIIGLFLIPVNILESQIIFGIGIALIGFIFFAFKNSLGLNFLNSILNRINFLRKFKVDVNEFQNSTKQLVTAKSLLQLLSITYITKILPMVAVYLVFTLFEPKIDIFASSQIYFTSLLAGLLTFIPGGIIVTETGLLGLSLKFGFDISTATVLVLLIRLLTFWFPTFVGFISLRLISSKAN